MPPSRLIDASAAPHASDSAWTPGRLTAALLALALLVRAGAMLASGAGLHVDEAQYWDWSRQLAWGYWSKPPGIAALIAASTTLFGDGHLGVRFLGMACWPLAAGVVYALGRSMGGGWVGAWAAAFFIATPAAGLLGMVTTTDAPLVLCWALAMLGCWQGWQARERGQGGWPWWVLAGVAAGLGMLSKYTMGAFALSAAWLAWRAPRARSGILGAAAIGLLVFSPQIAWQAANGWPTLSHTADITVDAKPVTGIHRLTSVLEFALGQVLMLGPVALVAGWRLRRQEGGTRPAAAVAFCLAFALPLLAIGLLQASHAKAQINWAAPFLVGACLLLALPASSPRQRGVVIAWCVGVALMALASQAGSWAPKLDLWARMRGWEPALQSLEPPLQAHPGLPIAATDRTVLSHASYAWRGLGREVKAWPAPGVPRNHYEQFRPLRAAGQPWPAQVLVLTGGEPEDDVRADYAQWQRLGSAQRGDTSYQVWLASRPTNAR